MNGPPSIADMQKKLDELYAAKKNEYYDHLQMVKGLGHRVFRNSAGKHIINIDTDYLNEAFGGIFKGIFNT